MNAVNAVSRHSYRAPDYLVESVAMDVDIRDSTTVRARLTVKRAPDAAPDAPLRLDGRDLTLLSLHLDGEEVTPRAAVDASGLTLAQVPAHFALDVVTRVDPDGNRSLEGLYRSGAMLCTQCEAQGFSRITYLPDRPDVLSRYTVRLEADRAEYPVLLSNGEPQDSGDAGDGRHFVIWRDPFPKPCYLFAIVAGRLARVADEYVTGSGRRVQLHFYCDPGSEDRLAHAIESLKASMAWDERVYGLECDLSTYMVVAARDFNMGAMENKGLNVFNARYVLASAQTATDADHDAVESVIAHEYFHNWTGNRVTCRSWFELSLKEGLTVFRDQCFSADRHSPAVQRIGEVRALRSLQFVEDAGPTAHAVRPDSYVEVNNLYTATVYEKGAEIVRMLQTVLGEDVFIRGVQRYLHVHDGSAATIEDFLAAHEAVSGQRLDGFRRWYAQPGTPTVTVTDEYYPADGRYRLILRQENTAAGGSSARAPVPIPIRFALRAADGALLPTPSRPGMLRDDLILLEEATLTLDFGPFAEPPLPSFLHGFSAPIRLQYGYSAEQLTRLALFEQDGFARWEAIQRLMLNAFLALLGGAESEVEVRQLCRTLQRLAADPPADRALLAELLRLPSEQMLSTQVRPLDAGRLCAARDRLRGEIARALTGPLSVWASATPEETVGADAAGRRALATLSLWYLAATGSASVQARCVRHAAGGNMTLAIGALQALNDFPGEARDEAMNAFRARFAEDALVLDKWFALQAASGAGDGLARIRSLMADPAWSDNPNRVRAVLVTLWRENLRCFHRPDGAGYRLLADEVARLDRRNPQLAARLVDGLLGWRDCVEPNASLLRETLEGLSRTPLSVDVSEKIAKALDAPVTHG